MSKETREDRLKKIEQLLAERPMSRMDLHKATGWSRSCVWHYTLALHDEHRIYVSDYYKSGSNDVEIYSLGNKPDKPWPIYEQEPEEIEIKRPRVVVKIRRDPYLWLSAGRAMA